MEVQEALGMLEALANGVDPTTGEAFEEDSPYQRAEITRALFVCVERLRHPPRKSPEERQDENLQQGRPRNAGLPWSDAMREELAEAFNRGVTLGELAAHFERSRGAVLSELKRQGLVKDYWHGRPSQTDKRTA